MERIKLIPLLLILIITGCATASQAKMPNYNSRQEYLNNNSELSPEIKQAILKGKVIEGMTKQDVLATWGEPSRIHKYSEHKRAIDATDEKINDEAWYYDQPFYSFAPKKFVRFGIYGIVNYVNIDYK